MVYFLRPIQNNPSNPINISWKLAEMQKFSQYWGKPVTRIRDQGVKGITPTYAIIINLQSKKLPHNIFAILHTG